MNWGDDIFIAILAGLVAFFATVLAQFFLPDKDGQPQKK